MNLLNDILTYMRRIIKSPSNAQISDNLLIDYINRFWLMDVDARIQLFDLKTKYQFQTTPGIADYNMPLYSIQTEGIAPGQQNINFYPVYQGFDYTCFANGIQIPFYTERKSFFDQWPNYVQAGPNVAEGTGVSGTYSISIPFFPAIPGHIDMAGIIATGSNIDPPFVTDFIDTVPTTSVYSAVYIMAVDANGQNVIVADSGQFLANAQDGDLHGLLMNPGSAPLGNTPLKGGYSTTLNTVNYITGETTFMFTDHAGNEVIIPFGNPIQAQCYFYQQGLPRAVLFYNNCITIRPPPDNQYLVELNAYLSPAAFLNSESAIPYAYMAEYIARGSARKILSDTGDIEQFNFYEQFFREQEQLVWKRSQRQYTSTRTGTIFSELQGPSNLNNFGQGAT